MITTDVTRACQKRCSVPQIAFSICIERDVRESDKQSCIHHTSQNENSIAVIRRNIDDCSKKESQSHKNDENRATIAQSKEDVKASNSASNAKAFWVRQGCACTTRCRTLSKKLNYNRTYLDIF